MPESSPSARPPEERWIIIRRQDLKFPPVEIEGEVAVNKAGHVVVCGVKGKPLNRKQAAANLRLAARFIEKAKRVEYRQVW